MGLIDKIKENPSKLFVVIVLVIFAVNALIAFTDPENWMVIVAVPFAYYAFYKLTQNRTETKGDIAWIGVTILLTFLLYISGFQAIVLLVMLALYVGVLIILHLYIRSKKGEPQLDGVTGKLSDSRRTGQGANIGKTAAPRFLLHTVRKRRTSRDT